MTRALLFLFVCIAAALGGSGWYVYHWLNTPVLVESVEDVGSDIGKKSIVFLVSPGASLTQVSNELSQKGYYRFPKILSLYGRLTKKTNIKVGEYLIAATETPKSLLEKFINGQVINYSVTLVEGKTFKETLTHLQTQKKLVITLKDQKLINDFIQDLEIEQNHPEGWFFPDTYNYSLGVTDKDILKQAYNRMRDVLATEWENRAGDLPYKNAYEALIMASIVERETGQVSERQQIAGVFVRRLEKKMRLQTDPTIIYGLGDTYSGNIRRQHLSQKTPYNTYVINGLPPTPIALPGREAIYAALHPDDGSALYFVAKGDGSHQFSATLEEHNKAVLEYQIRKRKKNYQSSPNQSSSDQ